MADELPPSLFNILREDLKTMGERLDKLVTTEAFATERRRVDDKFADQGREIGAERAERKADVETLERAVKDAQDRADAAKAAQEDRKSQFSRAMWIAAFSTVGAGVVGLIFLVIENLAHLR